MAFVSEVRGQMRVVTTIERCQKVVQTIMTLPIPVIGVTFKWSKDKKDPISLVVISSADGKSFVFDIKKNTGHLFEGGLGRILQSAELLKVLHACKNELSMLKRLYGIRMLNIYDTQVAYSILMESQRLPPRLINLHDLTDKYGVPHPLHIIDPDLGQLMVEDRHFWYRRPLAQNILKLAVADANVLVFIYNGLNKDLTPALQALHKIRCENMTDIIYPRSSRTNSCTSVVTFQQTSPPKSPILKPNKRQWMLLDKTIPTVQSPR